MQVSDGKEYVVQSSAGAAKAQSACVARSIPTPSDFDCAGASASWADNQVVIEITHQHRFLQQPKLRLSLSLYSASLSNAEADNAPEDLQGMLVRRQG